jgi:glycosyltransferase involved in cell wall biosynthesis
MELLPISVVILTLNESERIERCLESVRGFRQVIVVDSLSKDSTLDQARSLWRSWGEDETRLTLVSRAWPGFTKARNESLGWVREPWVLWLDADEWVSPELVEWCRSLDAAPTPDVVPLYKIARQSFFLGTPIRHGGWYPDHKRRLALSSRATWRSGPHGSDVHEDLDVSLEGEFAIALLGRGEIFHEPFRDEAEQRATNELYSGLLARGLAERWNREGRRRGPSELFVRVKVIVKFLENYFFKAGFLDGQAGLKIARGSAWSMGERLRKARALLSQKPPL